ncbi:hypothetical protein ABPG77_002189 [Micractinium sp. CCAP 211/92]
MAWLHGPTATAPCTQVQPHRRWAWLYTLLDFFTGRYLYQHLIKRRPKQTQQREQQQEQQEQQLLPGKPAAPLAVDVRCAGGPVSAGTPAGQAGTHGSAVTGVQAH